ncbi:hypothetical protein [Paractinoplanes lichenicola]|uniref:Uncharacterized protein n=1 Tax=Paractinoplanes lichenicola TaxID=2802976 RepID=A0ABS1VFG9_9ACTN|nr:hypothetical protein [Actinoplanes lichenicola]MBL7253444.1 hypothetical protein [Actinoplanes lichenicola]
MPGDLSIARLERRYRRWLLAYPRAYRHERGPEILATLLDAADPGRSRPAPREAALLLRHGLGRRLAEFGRRAFVIAAVAAVLGGLSGIALGSWLAWRDVDPMAPGKATAIALAPTVLPVPFDNKASQFGRQTFWNPYSKNTLHGGTGVRVGRTSVTGSMPQRTGVEQLATAVAGQMRAHGWRDVRITVEGDGPSRFAEVTGTRTGYLAAVQIGQYSTGLNLDLMWAEPPGHLHDTVLGGLAGALLGALLGLYTAKRMRRYGPGRQRAYSRLCVTTLLLLAPACLGNIPTSTGSLLANTHRNGHGPSVYWGGFVVFGAEPLAILALLPILAIAVCCVWPQRAPVRTPTTA